MCGLEDQQPSFIFDGDSLTLGRKSEASMLTEAEMRKVEIVGREREREGTGGEGKGGEGRAKRLAFPTM